MSKTKEIEQCYHNIKKVLMHDEQENEFLYYLEKYYNKLKVDLNDVLNDFDHKHTIFYNKTSQLYYNYIRSNYIVMNEDNLLYLVLEYITSTIVTDTHQKVSLKNKIIKQIKENNIYETIPDSNTIQPVLSFLTETFFSCKAYTKIFLIIIGSIIIQKKNCNNFLVFTRGNLKSFLNEISQRISIYFCNVNIFNYFKFKFTQDHENNHGDKYVIPCNKINSDVIKVGDNLYTNMIIIAIHYYNRYQTVEHYVTTENLPANIKKNLYLLNSNKYHIIQNFVDEYIIEEKKQEINQKEIIFLYKKITYEHDIFINVFTSYNDFVSSLFEFLKCEYDKSNANNVLPGYYSFELPYIDEFKKFWTSHFSYSETETNFELNEILYLYNKYNKSRKNNMNETLIKLVIQSFYSNFEVFENKFVNKLKCSLWNKKEEIESFLNENNIDITNNINVIYKKYISTKTEYRVSKVYFQNHVETFSRKS